MGRVVSLDPQTAAFNGHRFRHLPLVVTVWAMPRIDVACPFQQKLFPAPQARVVAECDKASPADRGWERGRRDDGRVALGCRAPTYRAAPAGTTARRRTAVHCAMSHPVALDCAYTGCGVPKSGPDLRSSKIFAPRPRVVSLAAGRRTARGGHRRAAFDCAPPRQRVGHRQGRGTRTSPFVIPTPRIGGAWNTASPKEASELNQMW